MSDISLLPDQLRQKEEEIRKDTVAIAPPASSLSMHMPQEEEEDVEVIEVEEGEVDQLLVGEPFYSRFYYRLSLWAEETKDKLFHARPVEPPPKLPPQFFKPPQPVAQTPKPAVQIQPAPAVGAAPVVPPSAKPEMVLPVETKPTPVAAVSTPSRPKARIIPSAPSRGKRVRIIKRVRKPVQVSLLDEQFVSAMQVNVGKRKFTLAFLTVFFALIFAGSYFLLDRAETAVAQEKSQVDASYGQLKTEIGQAQTKWASYQDLEPRLLAFNELMNKHMATSRVFDFLERNTLSDVSYANFSMDQTGKVTLSATAASYPAVARQLAIFKDAPEILTADANAFAGDKEKGVAFQLSLQFKPDSLLYKNGIEQKRGEQTTP